MWEGGCWLCQAKLLLPGRWIGAGERHRVQFDPVSGLNHCSHTALIWFRPFAWVKLPPRIAPFVPAGLSFVAVLALSTNPSQPFPALRGASPVLLAGTKGAVPKVCYFVKQLQT